MGAETIGVLIITSLFSVSLMTFVFFGLRAWNRRKKRTKEEIKETNRQRREREKLKRETKAKVTAYMKGEKAEEGENVPNGKRCGKYKKKNKKK